jgi:hypothetical protein
VGRWVLRDFEGGWGDEKDAVTGGDGLAVGCEDEGLAAAHFLG